MNVFERVLMGLDDGVRRAATAAVIAAAEATAQAARELAPCQSGALRQSIAVVVCDEGASAAVVAEVPYAAAVELGLDGRRPQPFLLPALAVGRDAAAPAALAALREDLGTR